MNKVAMESSETREEEINRAAELADVYLRNNNDTLIMTSRELITGKSEFSHYPMMNANSLP